MIIITQATEKDISLLQNLGKTTFYETFAASNTENDMADYLENGFSKPQILAELENNESAFYLAYHEGVAIGYLKLNWGIAQTELSGMGSAIEIERIYVLQKYQGMKVGQALYAKAIQVATEKKLKYIWLGVWEQNFKAIHFYEKNGFIAFDKHIFRLGEDEQIDIMMKKKL